MSKEYTYDIDKYTIGVDENGEDEISITVAIIKNGGIYLLGNYYGENARCINLLIKENQKLKKQLEEKENIACNLKDSCLENAGKIEILENQQKEFIKYLEDEISKQKNDIFANALTSKDIDLYIMKIKLQKLEEILQKYKGDDK